MKRFAYKQIRKKIILINIRRRTFTAKNYFDIIINKGIFTITFILYDEFEIGRPLIASIEHRYYFRTNDKRNRRKRRKITNGETDF